MKGIERERVKKERDRKRERESETGQNVANKIKCIFYSFSITNP